MIFENGLIKRLTKDAAGLIKDFSILFDADYMLNAG